MTRPLRHLTSLLLLVESACYGPNVELDDNQADDTSFGTPTTSSSDAPGPTPASDADGASTPTTTGTAGDDGPLDDGAGTSSGSPSDVSGDVPGDVSGDVSGDGSSDGPSASSDGGGSTGGTSSDNSRVVFLLFYAGAPMLYGGLEGADARCQQAADSAGLAGTFMAWLSASTRLSPATRFDRRGGPFVRTDGVVIADDWDDLVDGELHAPISITADGIDVDADAMPEVVVVTHTDHNGEFAGGIAPCHAYTGDLLVGPRRGTATASDLAWTEVDDDWSCDNDASGGPSLYCFAQ